MIHPTTRQILLATGFAVSVTCLVYIIVDGMRETDPFSVQTATTAVTRVARVVGGLFCVLDIPPVIIYIILESTLPHSLHPQMREAAVYAVVAVAVLGWWWL